MRSYLLKKHILCLVLYCACVRACIYAHVVTCACLLVLCCVRACTWTSDCLCGRVGVWACGRVGVWACGRVRVYVNAEWSVLCYNWRFVPQNYHLSSN